MSHFSEQREWSALEDSLLREAVKECQAQKGVLCWNLIAAHVPGRDRKSCHKRWYNKIGNDFNKGAWTAEEDERLVCGIEEYGERWALVATKVQTRSGDQCLQRWRNSLDPNINRTVWSEEEDLLLQEAMATYGHNWTTISHAVLNNRNALSIRNREKALRSKQNLIDSAQPTIPVLFIKDKEFR